MRGVPPLWLICCLPLALLVSCSIIARERTMREGGAVSNAAINVQHLDATPLSEALSQLHPTNRERLVDFISSVPDPLPNELAHPQAVFFDPRLPLSRNTLIVDSTNGHVVKEIAVANPGSNDRQTNVICLRNGDQADCTQEVNVWSVSLPAQSLAFVPVDISAAPGDMLTFLFIPDRESERFDPAASMLWLLVAQEPPRPSKYVEAPAQIMS